MKKKSKVTVKMGESSQVDFYKPLMNEIDFIFNHTPLFTSDEASLYMAIGTTSASEIVRRKEKEYILKVMNEAFGVKLSEKHLKEPFAIFLPWLAKNRTVYNKEYRRPRFLGIKSIEDPDGESWHMDYFFSVKSQLDYWTGWFLGKTDPKMLELRKSLDKEIKTFQDQVYGKNPNNHFLIKTEEGDTIMCQNKHEVCSWIEARASNYKKSGQREDW